MDIKVGDKVELAKTSDYYDIEDKSHLSGVGVVDKVLSGIGSLRYIVTWGDEGRRNGYDEIDLVLVDETLQAISSTGGSSSYYGITLPKWLLDKHTETGSIMLEDLAEVLFDNEFNFSTNFKSLHRAFQTTKGVGKKGNTLEYECNKVKYYADKIVEKGNRK